MTDLREDSTAPFAFARSLEEGFESLASDVRELRSSGRLTPQVLHTLRKYFRVKNIYHSNAIEGNLLTVGETRQVVEDLASHPDRALTESDVRQIHLLVLKGIDDENAGKYRSVQVEISGSQFKPTPPESLAAQMRSFGDWLANASVRGEEQTGDVNGLINAAIAHTWFVLIHPFVDGNGRVARLLMNVILMRYGFPIAIIAKEDRLRYYDSLEEAQSGDLSSFLTLLVECVHESLEEYLRAAQEQREKTEWLATLADKFTAREKTKAANEYEVWKSAMDLLKGYFRQTATMLDDMAQIARVYFKDFGTLEFEKYLSLKSGDSVKQTWFFRVDFRSGEKSARYLFFFGSPSFHLRRHCDVTLFVAREETGGSLRYQRLDHLTAPNIPSIVELGYKPAEETFISRNQRGILKEEKLDVLGRRFFEDVIDLHFKN
jgi:Fic family protein